MPMGAHSCSTTPPPSSPTSGTHCPFPFLLPPVCTAYQVLNFNLLEPMLTCFERSGVKCRRSRPRLPVRCCVAFRPPPGTPVADSADTAVTCTRAFMLHHRVILNLPVIYSYVPRNAHGDVLGSQVRGGGLLKACLHETRSRQADSLCQPGVGWRTAGGVVRVLIPANKTHQAVAPCLGLLLVLEAQLERLAAENVAVRPPQHEVVLHG